MWRISWYGAFDINEVLIRTLKVNSSTSSYNGTKRLPGDGNKILAVLDGDDFSHSLGRLRTHRPLPSLTWGSAPVKSTCARAVFRGLRAKPAVWFAPGECASPVWPPACRHAAGHAVLYRRWVCRLHRPVPSAPGIRSARRPRRRRGSRLACCYIFTCQRAPLACRPATEGGSRISMDRKPVRGWMGIE